MKSLQALLPILRAYLAHSAGSYSKTVAHAKLVFSTIGLTELTSLAARLRTRFFGKPSQPKASGE